MSIQPTKNGSDTPLPPASGSGQSTAQVNPLGALKRAISPRKRLRQVKGGESKENVIDVTDSELGKQEHQTSLKSVSISPLPHSMKYTEYEKSKPVQQAQVITYLDHQGVVNQQLQNPFSGSGLLPMERFLSEPGGCTYSRMNGRPHTKDILSYAIPTPSR